MITTSKIKCSYEHRMVALRLFFGILKKYDPESCHIPQSYIRSIRKNSLKKYRNNHILKYLFRLLSFVYATPHENCIIDKKHDYYTQAKLFEAHHK